MPEDQSREIEIAAHEEIPNLPAQIPQYQEVSPYQGIASSPFPPEVSKILADQIPDEDHDVLPTGEVYVPQVHYRRKLIKAFGYGGWALLPRFEWKIEGDILFREFALFVGGRYVSEAIGTQKYNPKDNERMTYAEATESAKSDALKKMCKDLGIASECWDRRWCEAWKKKFAVLVMYEEVFRGAKTGKKKRAWRRKDAPPVPYEVSTAQGGGAGPSGSSGSADAQAGGDLPISEPRLKRLFALMKQHGKTEAQVDEYILSQHKLTSKKEIKVSQYDAICKWVETPGEQAEADRDPGEEG